MTGKASADKARNLVTLKKVMTNKEMMKMIMMTMKAES